jgi:hypothetical protein
MTDPTAQEISPRRSRSLRAGLVTAAAVALLAGSGATVALAGGGGIGSGGGGGDQSGGGDRYKQEWNAFTEKDQKWARNTSQCESGKNPDAYNPAGPFYGAFQFMRPTWKAAPMSKGNDPRDYNWTTQAVVAVKWMHKAGKDQWPECGH